MAENREREGASTTSAQSPANGNAGQATTSASDMAATDSVAGQPSGSDKVARNPRVLMPTDPLPPLSLPLGYDEICKILPHRYPFLLVDRILELEPGHRCVGVKNVTANEEFFQGHFPGHPIMPGVLILEAMAQVAGLLTSLSSHKFGAISYFAAIEKARFRQPVRPGDQLVTEATLHVLRGPLGKVSVVGRVDGNVVVESDFTFVTAKDKSTPQAVSQATAVVPASRNGTGVAEPDVHHNVVNATPNGAITPAARSEMVSPPRESNGETYIHPTALVDSTAQLDSGVWVGPYCIIEGGTRIGKNTILEAHIVIKRGTSVGARCRIWPHVILGHEPQDMKFHGEESFLRIGDDNILREMVTVHRATGEGAETVIGNNNLLMSYVHVGHNCVVGDNTMISAFTGISGHVTIEDKVVIGGFAGVHQFVHIGKMVMIGGLSKVVQDVPPFCICDGRPSKVHGLNIRGLRRNGVPAEERNQVSSAFKLLFRSDLNTSQALERIYAEIPRSETLDYLVSFVERVREGRLGRQDETPHL